MDTRRETDMTEITKARILIIATHGFEQSELEVPRDKLRDAGAQVHVASPDGNGIKGWDGDGWGRMAEVDLRIEDADSTQYDALVLPGGQINPDILRLDPAAIALIQAFRDRDRPVAAICHAPWLLIEAGLVAGREVTSWPSLRTDLANAGAQVVDVPVARDRGLITSRNPDDLDAFVAAIIEEVEKGQIRADAA
ncbi:type 1 glutamine amidotransferase [Dinoroseobacter sp. PD6]|uniref:type 1 glutamine amidotransferase domain-containing protein n=1 Tax=Dinoroseobacter sp. PD6 TaxID=3028384 RepID=UPI00237AE1EF|nr:type 1 glutamine amidotransferase domain-containing protein [Dinoroseobacter sp. PD6]MDD9717256.1 type 1 glutamine amidotransferase [Dinoroseobacter sp. PD6]